MRNISFTLCLAALFTAITPNYAFAGTPQTNALDTIVNEARMRTRQSVRYDPKYVKLAYPYGDVDPQTGVCTDVIIRTFRQAFNFDFQKAVHEDMQTAFKAYPKIWGLSRPDKNIDHRRVPNLETYLKRRGAALKVTKNPDDYKPGDIVSYRLGGRLAHIGIVSDKKSATGVPLLIHNIGAGPLEEDMLFVEKMTGHFRFIPKASSSGQDVSLLP